MTRSAPRDSGYRFPPEIISHTVWLYHRFGLSFRGHCQLNESGPE